MEQWQEIRSQILNEMDLSREVSDEELRKLIVQSVSRYSREHLLSLKQRENYQKHIFNSWNWNRWGCFPSSRAIRYRNFTRL